MLSTKFGKSLLLTIGLLVFLYASFLRLYPLPHQPYWMDEGYTVNATLSYAAGRMHGIAATLDSSRSYECIMYCYPTSLLTTWFGQDPFWYRVLAAIFGLASAVVIYMCTRLLYSTHTALLASFLLLFSYFQIAWSTQARWYTMFLFFFWLTLYTSLKLFLGKNPTWRTTALYLTLTTLLAGATILTHKLGVLIVPILAATGIATLYYRHHTSRRLLITSICTLMAVVSLFCLFVIPDYLYNFASHISLHYTLPYYLSFYLRSYLVLVPFIIYTLVTGERRDWWLFGIFATYLIPLAFLTNIVHYRYLFMVTPVLFILAAVGADRLTTAIQLPKHLLPWRQTLVYGALIVAFFVSGTGTLWPQERYWLESDNPSTLGDRPSYAYTPQPDWNAAYAYIQENRGENDMVISSQPPMTKIFLHEPGYWIYYDYLGLDDRARYRTADNREFYVGAQILDTVDDVAALIQNNHGYIVYDYMAADGRIASGILDYIETNLTLVYQKEDNSYSKVWVYQF